jgi:magnesium-protoporphyrin O-methyltransferase
MPTLTYASRREQLETYFDRTAAEAWSRLTSDAPVGRIRATVRAGRNQMRDTLLGWLPLDLRGARLLDAGCGTGALAIEAASRGADVVAVDISPTLVQLARERTPPLPGPGRVSFQVGDMLDGSRGRFDYVVAMDSLIHYRASDTVGVLSRLAAMVEDAILFTFAPRTPALTLMHAVGRLFPRSDRAPSIEPVAPEALLDLIDDEPGLHTWEPGRSRRIACGFYTSEALELTRT